MTFNNISVVGTGKYAVFGIENQWGKFTNGTSDGIGTIYVNLTATGNGEWSRVLGYYGNALTAKDTEIILDDRVSANGQAMVAITTNDNSLELDNTTLTLTGNPTTDIFGIQASTVELSSLTAAISGGKAMTAVTGTNVNINGDANITVADGQESVIGIITKNSGPVSIAGDANMTLSTATGSLYGITATSGAVNIAGGVSMDMALANGATATAVQTTGLTTMGGNFIVDMHDTVALNRMAAYIGNNNLGGSLQLNGAVNDIRVAGKSNFMEGLFAGVKLADNSNTYIKVVNSQQGFSQTQGIYDRNDKGFVLGAGAILNMSVDTSQGASNNATGRSDGTFGLLLNNVSGTESITKAGSQLNIAVAGGAADSELKNGTVGIGGNLAAAGNVRVEVLSAGGIGLRAWQNEQQSYTGETIVKTNNGIAVSSIGGSNGVTINPAAGQKVQLTGDVTHSLAGTNPDSLFDLKLITGDSFLTGASTGVDASRNFVTNLSFANGAIWNMTADSTVDNLTVNAGGRVNMAYGPDMPYQTLSVDNLKGSAGNYIFDTDLNSEANGDKLVINQAAESGLNYIQVRDASITNNTEVIGAKKLLLVTDVSGNSSFTGKELDNGGLWDVTPTVEKDGNDWYLVKVEKRINPSTNDLIGTLESSYGLWRNTILDDNLRKRLGDVRYNDKNAGVWARIKAGKLSASTYDASYQLYQVGMDTKKGNSIYGFAVDHATGKNTLPSGTGESGSTGLSLYATTYHASGAYSDVVLRAGKQRGDMKSVGEYPDNVDTNAWGYSASYEVGKTFKKDNGWFVEPQGQFIYGHLNGGDYDTTKGTHARVDGINSYIARLGFVLGRAVNKNSEYYLKGNVYREFGGNGSFAITYDKQALEHKMENKDTWFELGLGGNVKLSRGTHVYGDVLKTFGANVSKKWQVNAGVRWEF